MPAIAPATDAGEDLDDTFKHPICGVSYEELSLELLIGWFFRSSFTSSVLLYIFSVDLFYSLEKKRANLLLLGIVISFLQLNFNCQFVVLKRYCGFRRDI